MERVFAEPNQDIQPYLPVEIHREIQSYLPAKEARNYGLVVRGLHLLGTPELSKIYQTATLKEVIETGDFSGFQYLIQNGANLNQEDMDLAIALNRFRMLKAYYETDPDIGTLTEIIVFSILSNPQLALKFIEDIPIARLPADELLALAAHNQNYKIMMLLLKKGANINYHDGEILLSAIRHKNSRLTNFLISHGANIHARNEAPLILAVHTKNLPLAHFLLSHDANLHVRSENPLILASQTGNLDMVKLLVKYGADIRANQFQAFKLAKDNGFYMMLKYLESQL